MVNKLELTWYGKDEPIKVEPRLLIENAELSNTALAPDTENMLIHGDNLLALKALEKKFAGQVKCIYIDPPYNVDAAAGQYDDNIEHSQWLNLMRPRIELLHSLLKNDGSLWISIDDEECHYLKVLCDSVFGRKNFVASIIWRKNYAPKSSAKHFSVDHDYILVYAKDAALWTPNLMPRTARMNSVYKNPDNDPRGPWRPNNLAARNPYSLGIYSITCPSGRVIPGPPKGSYWRVSEEKFWEMDRDGRIYWGKDGNNVPAPKIFLSEVKQGAVPQTYWSYEDVGHTQDAKKESIALFAEMVFSTPKPERLVERVLTLATNPGDLVLDSFLGSGTTAAVAHKMGRRYIGIEMGDHAYTHCKVRLDKVIAGEDQGGITKTQNWLGGGGYRFYELAPTLINEDAFGEAVINPDYDADQLAAAVALHEGFTYRPNANLFWKQAVGNENSYLFTTTRHLTAAYLDAIKSSMEEGEYLVIACRSFDQGLDKAYGNITVKKIPQMLLDRCEFGKTDYNLNIVHPPVYEDEEADCDE